MRWEKINVMDLDRRDEIKGVLFFDWPEDLVDNG